MNVYANSEEDDFFISRVHAVIVSLKRQEGDVLDEVTNATTRT